jgi:hypothetical protein
MIPYLEIGGQVFSGPGVNLVYEVPKCEGGEQKADVVTSRGCTASRIEDGGTKEMYFTFSVMSPDIDDIQNFIAVAKAAQYGSEFYPYTDEFYYEVALVSATLNPQPILQHLAIPQYQYAATCKVYVIGTTAYAA